MEAALRRALGWLTLISAALALMSAGLAWAWAGERARADCWQAAAELALAPDACR